MNWEVLREWFRNHKRDLPWRLNPSPYRVWVSEVMLQQTQVAVVLPYFERWMAQFPTLEVLAQASVEEVIKCWEGLGYYSRARNLHAGAQQVVQEHGGELPADPDQLRQIKGIGPYTVGAIRAFAFHQRAVAVDGNVLRVGTRLLGLDWDIAKAATRNHLEAALVQHLPEEAPWEIAEALIELGATVCQKKPACHRCPMRSMCVAYRTSRVNELPVNSRQLVYTQLYRAVPIVVVGQEVLVRRGRPGEVMADLYEFPYFELQQAGIAQRTLIQLARDQWKLSIRPVEPLDVVRMGFTRYRATLFPWLCMASSQRAVTGLEWMPIERLNELPFSSGHRKLRTKLLSRDEAQSWVVCPR